MPVSERCYIDRAARAVLADAGMDTDDLEWGPTWYAAEVALKGSGLLAEVERLRAEAESLRGLRDTQLARIAKQAARVERLQEACEAALAACPPTANEARGILARALGWVAGA